MKKIGYILIFLLFISPVKAEIKFNIPIDITTASITEIQDAIENGTLNYETLITLYLERIEAYDTIYNTMISINENALEEAKERDKEYQNTNNKSLLYGLPIVVKDNIDVVGFPTTGGSTALLDAYPIENAPIVQQLLDAGAIIIGKCNMSEFAFGASNSRSSFGDTYNAYNTLYSPYGSSGGVAVAVAANFAVAGIGTDTNASIRMPASTNNLVGLRPTYGTLDSTGILPYDISRDTPGIITRYVIDNQIVYDLLSGSNTTLPSSEKIKIGVLTQFMNKEDSGVEILTYMDEDIKKQMENALTILEELEYDLVYIDDFYNEKIDSWNTSSMMGSTFCNSFNNYIVHTKSSIQSFEELYKSKEYIQDLSYNYQYCDIDDTEDIENSALLKERYQEYFDSILEEYDVSVLVYPTVKNKTITIEEIGTNYSYSNSYAIAPALGIPAIAVPIGFIDGLPYGMEIITKQNQESLLYSIASKYESVTNYYKNPELVPSLYEVTEEIKNVDAENDSNIPEKKEINLPLIIGLCASIPCIITLMVIIKRKCG